MPTPVPQPERSRREEAGECNSCPKKRGKPNPAAVGKDGKRGKLCRPCLDKDKERKSERLAKKAAAAAERTEAVPAPSQDEPTEPLSQLGFSVLSGPDSRPLLDETQEQMTLYRRRVLNGDCVKCPKSDVKKAAKKADGTRYVHCEIHLSKSREQNAATRKKQRAGHAGEPTTSPPAAYSEDPNPPKREVPFCASTEWDGDIWMEDKHLVLARFGPQCWACKSTPEPMKDGSIRMDSVAFDHIAPKKNPNGIRGSDAIWNRAVLCHGCNLRKGNRITTIQELRAVNYKEGYISHESEGLQDLGEALAFAVSICERRAAESARQAENSKWFDWWGNAPHTRG